MRSGMMLLSVVLLSLSHFAEAGERQASGLADYLASSIESTDHSFVQACTERSNSADEDSDSYEFQHFFLTLKPSVSFGFNDVLSLEIAPEITFIWERVPLDP